MNKKLIALLTLCLLLLAGCGKENAAAADEKAGADAVLDTEKTYVVGLDDTFAPMGFRDESGELIGFDVELARDAAKRMGIELDFQPVDWTMKEQELESGNIDFIWNGYSITPEREEMVAFSEPYMDNRQIIVTQNDSPVNSKADLAGKRIAVQGESSALKAVMEDAAFVDTLAEVPVEYATNVECFKDVEAGRSDALVVDEVLARYYMKENGEENYKVLDENFGEERYAVGMRKDDVALKFALDQAMKEQKEDGTYDKIYATYFAK